MQTAATKSSSRAKAKIRTAGDQMTTGEQATAVVPYSIQESLRWLQRTLGNRGVQHMLRSLTIQPKLSVNQPGDQYEQEADRVADTVMRILDTPVSERSDSTKQDENNNVQTHAVSRMDQKQLHTKPASKEEGDAGAGSGVEAIIEQSRGDGRSLEAGLRRHMESAFGANFGGVRIHTDSRADGLNRAVDAVAFTSGQDIFFRAGSYDPSSSTGRQLLAHELTHVAQWTNLGLPTWPDRIQRSPFPGGTNYRFDTYQVTASDLHDPDFIARFDRLSLVQLREYQKRVSDPQVGEYILHLIAAKSGASSTRVDRAAYIKEVQAAIKQLEGAPLARETLVGVILPFLRAMGQPDTVSWKDAKGVETAGKSITYLPPGKGAKKIHLQLVLDEVDPDKEERRGHFSTSDGKLTLVVRKAPTADSIRETLYHESIHVATHILQSQGATALGSPKDIGIKSLSEGLAKSEEIDGVKHLLALLNDNLNASRTKRNAPLVTADTIEAAAKELWEEQVVRAETFFFELRYWMEKGGPHDRPPTPNYHSMESIKFYLKTFQVVTDADLTTLTPDGEELIGRIRKLLMYRQRGLIKRHGVSNLYAPHPMELPPPVFVTGDRPRIKLGPMGGELEHDLLKEIEKSVEDPVFEGR